MLFVVQTAHPSKLLILPLGNSRFNDLSGDGDIVIAAVRPAGQQLDRAVDPHKINVRLDRIGHDPVSRQHLGHCDALIPVLAKIGIGQLRRLLRVVLQQAETVLLKILRRKCKQHRAENCDAEQDNRRHCDKMFTE